MEYPPHPLAGALSRYFGIAALVCAPSLPAAELEWLQTTREVVVEPGASLATVEFRVRNTGSRALAIAAATPTCDCVSVEFERAAIPPGGTASLAAVVREGGLEKSGEKIILVKTDEPDAPPVSLRIQIVVRCSLEAAPESVFWPLGAEEAEKRVIIAASSERAIQVRTSPRSSEAFAVRTEWIEERRKLAVLVRPITSNARVHEAITLVISIDGVGERTIRIPASVQ